MFCVAARQHSIHWDIVLDVNATQTLRNCVLAAIPPELTKPGAAFGTAMKHTCVCGCGVPLLACRVTMCVLLLQVSDVNDDVRRAAVIAIGFLLFR